MEYQKILQEIWSQQVIEFIFNQLNLLEGPLGQVAATSDILKQGRALLPNAPAAGSAPAIADTVTRLAMRHPDSAANVIHARIRAVFDEATQNLSPGPNQWGGAKFAAEIRGNSEQARVLQEAVRSLVPNGDARWAGLNRFLDIAEATGKRPQPGSMTAFNAADQARMTGGAIKDVVTAPLSLGTSVVRRINQFGDQMMMGRNTEQIARILVNPNSGRLLERLAGRATRHPRAAMLALRLSYMGRAAARGAQTGPEAQK